ncbi:MAG TPA: hypothetical protein PLG90_10930 [Ignavibacteria bacterium]|nr:hypothetical protein [Ignavibacteria bacterium]
MIKNSLFLLLLFAISISLNCCSIEKPRNKYYNYVLKNNEALLGYIDTIKSSEKDLKSIFRFHNTVLLFNECCSYRLFTRDLDLYFDLEIDDNFKGEFNKIYERLTNNYNNFELNNNYINNDSGIKILNFSKSKFIYLFEFLKNNNIKGVFIPESNNEFAYEFYFDDFYKIVYSEKISKYNFDKSKPFYHLKDNWYLFKSD